MTPDEARELWEMFVQTPVGFIVMAMIILFLAIVLVLAMTRLVSVFKMPRKEATTNSLLSEMLSVLAKSEANHQNTAQAIEKNTTSVALLAQSLGNLQKEIKATLDAAFDSAITDMRGAQTAIVGHIKSSEQVIAGKVEQSDQKIVELRDTHSSKLDVIAQQAVVNFQMLQDIVQRAETNRVNIAKNAEQLDELRRKLETEMSEQERRLSGKIDENGKKRHDENVALLDTLNQFKQALDKMADDINKLKGAIDEFDTIRTQIAPIKMIDQIVSEQRTLLERMDRMSTLLKEQLEQNPPAE